MKTFVSFANKLATLGAYLASLLFIALVGLILTEIVLRSFFDTSTLLADEYSGYFYLAAIFLGLAYTFKEGAHIRINILTSRLNTKKNRYVDIVAGLISVGVLAFMLYRSMLLVIDAYELEMLSEMVSETPIYLTQLAMPVGITFFMFSVLAFVFERIHHDS